MGHINLIIRLDHDHHYNSPSKPGHFIREGKGSVNEYVRKTGVDRDHCRHTRNICPPGACEKVWIQHLSCSRHSAVPLHSPFDLSFFAASFIARSCCHGGRANEEHLGFRTGCSQPHGQCGLQEIAGRWCHSVTYNPPKVSPLTKSKSQNHHNFLQGLSPSSQLQPQCFLRAPDKLSP